MFYEAMEELLPKLKVIIDDGSGNIQKYYPIESFANLNQNATSTSNTDKTAEEAAK